MVADSSRAERPRSRRGRRVRRALVALALAIGALGLGAWIVRDWPRRWLERRLTVELDAEVRLGRLEVASPGRFVLSRLDVRHPRWEPRLERVTVETIEVTGHLGEIRENRIDRLVADGVEVRLAPPRGPAEPAPASTVLVRSLVVRRGRVVASGPAGESGLEFTARLADWGAEPSGEIAVAAAHLDLAPWLAVLGLERSDGLRASAESANADVLVSRGSEPLRFTARGEALEAGYGVRGIRAPQWTLDATVARDPAGGSLRVDARVELPGIESAHIAAELDRETLGLERGRLALTGIALETLLEPGAMPAGDWTVDGLASLEVTTEDGIAFQYVAGAEIAHLGLPLAGGRLEAREARLAASGTARRGDSRISYDVEAATAATISSPRVELSAPACRLEASGEIDPSSGGPLHARLSVAGGRGSLRGGTVPAELFPLELVADGGLELEAAPRFSGTLGVRAPGGGEVLARGTIEAAPRGLVGHLRWSWSGAPGLDALRASAVRMGLALPAAVSLAGRPRASGILEGPLGDAAVRGRLEVDELEVSAVVGGDGDRWSVSRGAARADFAREPGDGWRVSIDPFELRGELRHEAAPVEAWIRPLVVAARGALDPQSRAGTVDEATVTVEGLARARLRAGLDAGGALSASAALDAVELAPLRAVARRWVEDPAPDYELEGTLAVELDAERSPDGRFRARGTLDLGGMGFSSADGSRVAQGAASRFSFELAGGPEASLEGRATGSLAGPLLLWGTLFGDYSTIEAEIDATARREAAGWTSSVTVDLPDGVRLAGRLANGSPGVGDPRRVEYALSAGVPDLGAFFQDFVRGPLEGSVAGLDALEASGRLQVELTGEVGTRRTARGTLDVTGASFSGAGDGTAIDGLDLALPLDLAWPSRDAAAAERAGSLAVERLRLAGVDFPALRTALTVAGDTVRLDRPLRLALLGGHVDLERLALVDWSRASRHLRFGLALEDLDLRALSAALETFPLEGRVNGSFPTVRLAPETLEVDGGGGIDVFGGRVEIFDISGREVLGRFPRLSFSARYDGIRLLDVTRTVDFGEVEGVVRGEIRGCELFRGTPVRCEADLQSVDTAGVPQRISVKAIRNISILGSGSRVGLLDRGLQSFFDRYTYEAIGIEMRLDRDRFELRGTERRGTKELFVKGRFPFRIDIVNVAPGHAVSFQTMLARLGNLEMRPTPPASRRGPSD